MYGIDEMLEQLELLMESLILERLSARTMSEWLVSNNAMSRHASYSSGTTCNAFCLDVSR